MRTLSLDDGFILDDPPITIPWGLNERELVSLLEPHGLQNVAPGYFVLPCRSLNGLSHQLGIRFDPSWREKKYCLSFYMREGH